VALLTQVVVLSLLPDLHGPSVAAHLSTYVLAMLFVLLNSRTGLIAAGGLGNLIAIAANGGTMPADPQALRASGWTPAPGHFANSDVVAHPRVAWLGDVFYVPSRLPVHSVFSVGDVVIVVGVAVFLHQTCRRPAVPTGLDPSLTTSWVARRSPLHPGILRRVVIPRRAAVTDRSGAQLVVPGLVAIDLAEPVLGAVLGQPRGRAGGPDVDGVAGHVSRPGGGGHPSGGFLFGAVLRDGLPEQLLLVPRGAPAAVDVGLDPFARSVHRGLAKGRRRARSRLATAGKSVSKTVTPRGTAPSATAAPDGDPRSGARSSRAWPG